jgi:hypothetical protein
VRENHSKGELDMPMKKHKPEQIVALLRQIEVEIANGKNTPQACKEAEIRRAGVRRKTKIDGAGGELTGFEMRAVTQHHDPIEGQARFRALPVNELINGMTITPLCVC